MCEFHRCPYVRYDQAHLGDGSAAPNCVIRVDISCDESFCEGGDMEVEVLDGDTGDTLTDRVPVTCAGGWTRHDLPMKTSGGLVQRKVIARFHCCDLTKDAEEFRIYMRCT